MIRLSAGTAALALVLAVAGTPAAAQDGQLNLIVGFGAGGSADNLARVVGNKLGERLNQKVVIENRPGAGANLAAKAVIAARPDGQTLLVTTAALAINNTLYKNKGFEITELRALSICGGTPETMAINKDNPANNMAEFIAASKGKKLNYSTAGVGTGSHIVADFFFKTIAKVEVAHVPFRSGSDAINALMGGHVDFSALSLSGAAGQINGGLIKGIAIATEKRFPTVPQVPTYAEAGFPGLVWSSWAGFFTHAKAPDAVVQRINQAIVEILKEKDVRERLEKIGFAPMSGELKESDTFFQRELVEWGKMVRTLGMSVE